MSGRKKRSKQKIVPLPTNICTELRMTCALKGYSKLKCDDSKMLQNQQDALSKFYHGKEPSHPSQIKLLAIAHLNYRDMYNEVTTTTKNKTDTICNVKTYCLNKY